MIFTGKVAFIFLSIFIYRFIQFFENCSKRQLIKVINICSSHFLISYWYISDVLEKKEIYTVRK